MGTCLNRNVLIGLGVVAGGVLILAPQAFLATVPLLLVLACPLSMILMMRGMEASRSAETEPPDDTTTPARTDDQASETTRLRAEIDQLRAELRDQPQSRLTGDTADTL
jgi:hypothetical protein